MNFSYRDTAGLEKYASASKLFITFLSFIHFLSIFLSGGRCLPFDIWGLCLITLEVN